MKCPNKDCTTTMLESAQVFTHDKNTNSNSNASELGDTVPVKLDTYDEVHDDLYLDLTFKK